MKLKTYINSTTFEATKDMISSIDNSDISIEHIVVVPDRFSLQMEKLLLQTIKKSLFNVRVMGLTSLAGDIFSRLHKKVDILSSAESLLLTQKAIENVKQNFIAFRKSGISFCYEINKLLSQLKSCEILPDDLNIKAEGLSGAKYNDIMLIYKEYQKLLNGKLDANERLSLLIDEVKKSDILKNTKFYFAQFDSFTKEGYSLIKTLVESASEVNISLASPLSIGNDYIYEKDILQKLATISREENIEIENKVSKSQLSKEKEAIIKGVYSYQPYEIENKGFYSSFSAQNVYSEVNGLAKLIYYFITKGYHYNDIVVATSQLSRYQDKIEKQFDKFDIPYFIDSSITADKTILARLILDFLQLINRGYQSEDLQNLFSNILINQSEIVEIVQHYNVDNRVKYKKHISNLFNYNYILEKIEKCKTAKDYQIVITDLLEQLQEQFDSVMDILDSKSYLKEKMINEQSKDILLENINLISKYSEGEIKLGEYIKMLKLLLSFKEVSSVPTFVDGVMVGDATASYFGDCKILILLGSQDLPQISSDSGILSDYDLSLNYINKKIEPTIRMINRRNRFKVFNLLSLPTERLICFTRTFDDDGKKTELPAFVDSLNKIFNQKTIRCEDVFYYNETAHGNSFLIKLGCRKNFIEENLHYLSKESLKSFEFTSDLPFSNFEINKEKINNSQMLYFNKRTIYVTQLEQYFSCPFKHFISYGLKLKEKETSEFDVRDIGNICHYGAELFVKYLMDRDYDDLDNIDINHFIDDCFDEIIEKENVKDKIINASESKSLISFFKHQLYILFGDILSEIKSSYFRPKYLEKKLDCISLGNNFKVEMSGKTDRIDECEKYFRIIDYKTGRTGNLIKELYYGEKLQLFLYQRIVKKVTKKEPAGVFYFNAKYNYDKYDDDKQILKGIAENNDDSLKMFDKNLSSSTSKIISLYKNKNGEFKGSAVAKEKLSVYENYAFAIANKAVDEIASGYIYPKPHEKSCEFCKYRSICGHENVMGERKLLKVENFKGIKEDE